LLTSNQWKFLPSKTDGVADVIFDCEKDDFMIFESNGTYTWNPSTVKCDPSETIDAGIWSFSSDEAILTINDNTITLIELTTSKLVMSITDAGGTWEQT